MLKSSRIDIVTAADTEAEAAIVAALLARFPGHHIVGEEGGGQGAPVATAPYQWFVDPIDGTVNFAAKLPHFCTSIALATPDREPLLGVIYDPTRRELFTAVKGQGARLNGQPLRVTQTAELIDAVITSGFPYDKHTNPDNNLKEWTAFLRLIRGERRLGSAALDLSYVAAGRLDGYRHSRPILSGPPHPWRRRAPAPSGRGGGAPSPKIDPLFLQQLILPLRPLRLARGRRGLGLRGGALEIQRQQPGQDFLIRQIGR